MKLLVLLLIALPACLGQFSIQGPSDGHRVAQGLKYSQEKGIEYTDQNESQGTGDFTIQGATDGNSDFRIQGATDGHSDFQIQGANDGGAARFHIQGATDGHSQSVIQGPYDANHAAPKPAPIQYRAAYQNPGPAKSLEYNDPSGLRVNWRSYERQPRPQVEAQYSEPVSAVPQQRHGPVRAHSQPPPPPPPPPPQPQPQPQPQPVYRPYDNAPPQIKQLLQFQAQIPYLNIIPEQFRYESLLAAQGQAQQAPQPQYQDVPSEPRAHAPPPRPKSRPHSRQRRQAPQHSAQQQGPHRLSQPPVEAQPQYSTNLPPNLQQLLKFQSQIPYINVIPEQYRYDPTPAIQEQAEKVRAHFQNVGRELASQGQTQTRHRRQAPQHQQRTGQPQYRRISQPPTEPAPQYSANVPQHIQSLLKYQSQIPYNIIANQIVYRPEKPYVPQPGHSPQPAQAEYQGQGGAYQGHTSAYQGQASTYQGQANTYQGQPSAYQGQANTYQGQPSAYQGQPSAYQGQASTYQGQASTYQGQQVYSEGQPQYQQPQAGYGQIPGTVRPVTENQY